MGILSDFKDNIVVSRMSKKPHLNIEELAKLSENQIKKMLEKKEIFLVNVGKISSYELAKNFVELYKISKKDYDDITLFFASSEDHEVLKIFETSKDISNIKSILSEEIIKRFISDPSYKINVNFFSEEFIKNNNDIFLVDVLPEEVRKRYYDKNITEKDLLENITVFRNMKHSDIIFKSVRYNDENSKKIISKLGLNGLTKVIDSLGMKFYNFYNDPEKMKSMCNFLNNKNTADFSTQVINYIYTNKELLSDLSISDNSYSISSSLDTLNVLNINKIDFVNYFNKTFSHIENNRSFCNFVSSFLKVFKEQKNFRSIDELFEEAAILTTKIGTIKEEMYTKDFIEKHQQKFLPSDAPAELKEKYYNKHLTYKDVKDNLRYFLKTNISVAFFDEGNHCCGLFDNECFLKILELCEGDLNKINFNVQCKFFADYLSNSESKINYISSYDEFLSLAEKYYTEHGIAISELESLKMLGINKKSLEEIENNIKRFGIQKDNIYFDIRLLSDEVIKRFNFGVIRAAATYYNSGAIPLLIEYSKDDQLAKKLNDWFALLNNNDKNMLNERNINYIIISFKECLPLIDELLNYNIALSEKQMKNLADIIVSKNKYNVRTIDELTNYAIHRKKVLNDKFESNSIDEVQKAIIESLFSSNAYFNYSLIKKYNLDNDKLYKKYIQPNIPIDIAAAIEIIKVINSTKDINKLKEIFNNAMSLGNTGINMMEIESALRNAYTQLYNNELFKEKENKTYYINGTNSLECPKNVNGEDISSNNKIKVVELNGEPFKLIIHCIRSFTTDITFEDPSIKMFKNPSLWNTKEGATTLSTSLISNTCFKLFSYPDSKETIFFGFNEIPSDVLMGMQTGDAGVAHGGGKLKAEGDIDEMFTPEGLTSNTFGGYNEVALMRRSQENNLKFNGRVQPTCIVCFDGYIDEKAKLAAQYFNVPIYNINKKKYDAINTHNKEMYLSGEIEKFDNSDIETIFSVEFKEFNRAKICVELCKKAFSEKLINEQQYYERLQYIMDYAEENKILVFPNDIEEINTILSSRGEVNESGITR